MIKLIVAALMILLSISRIYASNSGELLILNDTIPDGNHENTDSTSIINSDSLSHSQVKSDEVTHTTQKCTVTTISKKKYIGVHIFGLSDSTVIISNGRTSKKIRIKDIRSIEFKRGGFWNGALIGGGTAFLIGLVPYMIFSDTSASSQERNDDLLLGGIALGTAFAIPFALIGGLIGQGDKEYDLRKFNFYSKKKKIRELIKEYSKR